jgi:predicted O-linked N-acetylglucosamine transferase (SPINDLY family)
MMRLGLDDLIAHSTGEYANLAVELADNPILLEELRLNLRDRFLSSQICDVPGFVRELEETYRRVWRDWCGRSPEKRVEAAQ